MDRRKLLPEKTGNGTALVGEPFESCWQTIGIYRTCTCACHDAVEDIKLWDRLRKACKEPAGSKECESDVYCDHRFQLFGKKSADEAHKTVDKHINGICHAEVRLAPAELICQRKRKQAEISRFGGEKALYPDACKNTPSCGFCNIHDRFAS